MNGETRRRLPVWRTVIESYRATFENWLYAVRISWAWLLPLVALAVASQLLAEQLSVEGIAAGRAALLAAAVLTILAIYGLLLASIAVAWHRKLLREETCPEIAYFRLDRNVWRYILYGLLIALVIGAVAVALFVIFFAFGYGLSLFLQAPPSLELTLTIGVPILTLLIALLLMLAMFRLSVLLPGIALDRQPLSLRNAWRHTRGNTWRIFLAMVLCTIPSGLAIGLLVFAFITWPLTGINLEPSLSLGFVLLTVFDQVTNLLIGFIALSFLSFSYRFFYEPETLPKEDAAF